MFSGLEHTLISNVVDLRDMDTGAGLEAKLSDGMSGALADAFFCAVEGTQAHLAVPGDMQLIKDGGQVVCH